VSEGAGLSIQRRFWNWFIEHEADLYDFERDQKRMFNSLETELHRVDSNLVFEFGPKTPTREFVISADGIRSSFPSVVSLYKAAPALDRWKIVAFRPRRWPISTINIRGKVVNPEKVEFALLNNGGIAGVRLFVPGFREDESEWKMIAYLLLDEALGEFDVETKLGMIQICTFDGGVEETHIPFVELPQAFDRLVAQLDGRANLPS
jgi:hypothetical protein